MFTAVAVDAVDVVAVVKIDEACPGNCEAVAAAVVDQISLLRLHTSLFYFCGTARNVSHSGVRSRARTRESKRRVSKRLDN